MKKISKEEWRKRITELLKASEICRTISEVIKMTGYSRNVIQFTLKQFEDFGLDVGQLVDIVYNK